MTDIRGYPVPAGQGLHARAWVFCAARGRSRTLSARAVFPGAECWHVTIMRRLAGEGYFPVISVREGLLPARVGRVRWVADRE